MNRLIICDTLYQIMIAIHMSQTLFVGDNTDIWISDHSKGTEQISDRLKTCRIVHDVRFIRTREIDYEKSWIKKAFYIIKYGFGIKTVAPVVNYDEIIFYGMSLTTYGIEEIYRKRKYETVWSKYEEGVLSYETDFSIGRAIKVLEKIRKLLRMSLIRDKVKNYYCFIPNLKKTHREWNIIQIPKLNENIKNIIPIFKKVFDCKGILFPQKYVFFASSYDVDGHSFGETDIIFKIADIVGKENLLVKVHPRDTRKIYKDNDINVMLSDEVPWEIMQICSNLEDKILLTVVSGSFITINSIYESKIQCGFLLSMVETSHKDERFQHRELDIEETLMRLHENGLGLNITFSGIDIL